MTDKEKLRYDLAMNAAVAMAIVDELGGQRSNVPVKIVDKFILAYRQLGLSSFQPVVQRIADEIDESE